MAKLHSIRKLINLTLGLVAINKFVINKYPEMKTKSKGNTCEAMGARRCRPEEAGRGRKKGGVKSGDTINTDPRYYSVLPCIFGILSLPQTS
jgi:hypothetical protein